MNSNQYIKYMFGYIYYNYTAKDRGKETIYISTELANRLKESDCGHEMVSIEKSGSYPSGFVANICGFTVCESADVEPEPVLDEETWNNFSFV